MYALCASEGRLKTVAALLSLGAPADAVDKVWLDPSENEIYLYRDLFTFMLECVCTHIAYGL